MRGGIRAGAGRPKGALSAKYPRLINLRLSDAQYALIKAQAEKELKTMSDLIRDVIMNYIRRKNQMFYMMEKQNANSYREPAPLKAKTLTAAKVEASKKQAFEGTVLEIGCDPDKWEPVSRKEGGHWIDLD